MECVRSDGKHHAGPSSRIHRWLGARGSTGTQTGIGTVGLNDTGRRHRGSEVGGLCAGLRAEETICYPIQYCQDGGLGC